MNKIFLSIMLMILSCISIYAQTVETVSLKVYSENEKQPLIGATVYIKKIDKGVITDADGIARFEDVEHGTYTITISFLGYTTIHTKIEVPSTDDLVYFLKSEGNELDEVVLQSTRSTRTIKRIPTRIEYIGGEELGEKIMMNPTNISMVLRESTGIQMQQTSLSSGNSNIRIQGLDGRYTQLLRDGFPLYGGFSSGLSILQIPPVDLKQFEIIKGSSSTLYGGGAIAGLVNIISKTPDYEADLDIMLNQTQALGSTASIFYSKRNEKFGLTMYSSGNYQKAYDPEDDGFSNLPLTKSVTVNPKLFYYPSENTTFWFGLNGTYDDRTGGDIVRIEDGRDGINRYTEENISKRLSSQAVYTSNIDDTKSINIKNSISFFDRDLTIPDLNFSGKQINTFTEATYRTQKRALDWIFGANLYTVNFNEDDNSTLQRDQDDVTLGVFTNTTYDLSTNWIIEAGLRTDYAVDWGFFPLPRVSLLYKSETNFSSRIGGGLGYKIPDIFTEEAEFISFNNVLAIDKDALKAERSYGINLDFNYQAQLTEELGFSINQLFYTTMIDNGLILNTEGTGFFAFENADGKILSKGAETNIKFTYKDFRWFLNYAFIDTRLNYLDGNPQKPLTARHNAGSVIMYESPVWRFGFETYYTGKQILSNSDKTTDFITMGFLAMKNFKWGSAFANFENFTDRRQSRYSPLVLPPNDNPTFTEIYAPTDGFIVSLGVILKPFGNKGH
ncbi:TonB-dependent receptor [Aquimarina sp. AD10]|uniref:TonB-dependent receptor n=1 Tax=Aquimarina sp. AD10 TaxID=1714849 RepID=UPI000E549E52|nr:TonB-dependent receptor [Aquimarina sp. AD10]AXT59662.1 TonB-dependent receptor [Aquimarina sp. AD10]RKM97538.1 TonB-dependent receptor [Aquimarina sp. AD10]